MSTGPVPTAGDPGPARYDGHADWYEHWSRTVGEQAMRAARAALVDLLPTTPGRALDIGCGTGLVATALAQLGWDVVGVDLSGDQLRWASSRVPVARADAVRLPVRSEAVDLVVSVLTHTDVPAFADLVAEAVRVLRPGGCFLHVGVHPCFVNPMTEHLPDGARLHPGYREAGWQPPTPHTGAAVRSRVGVHHLPLQDVLTALLHRDAPVEAVIERGGGALPELLAVRLRRRASPVPPGGR